MKRMPYLLSLISYLLSPICLAQVPLRMDVETSEARTRYLDVYRGETVAMELAFRSYGEPLAFADGTPATIFWQTNGMAAAWWTAPASAATNGLVSAAWTPAMDCGAERYSLFVGVGAASRMYRASFQVRMRGAPGYPANPLPLPVEVLDFAAVAWTNAPWALPYAAGDNIVITNGVISSTASGGGGGGGISEEKDPEFGKWLDAADYTTVSNRAMSAVQPEELGTAAYAGAGDFAAASEVASVRQTANAAARDADLVYQLMVGSNVVVEVTNYNSRVRSPQLRLLQLDGANGYITVWTETNGLFRVADAATNHTDVAIADEVRRADGAYAPRAWSRTTSGLGSEAPSNTTWVSTPVTVIAGGYEYEKHVTSDGEVWVLCSNGLSLGGDTNAYFRISSGDGEPLFAVEKTDAQLIGVRAGAISVTSSGGANLVTVPLDVVSSTAPVCLVSDDLAGGQWHDLSESAPAWVTAYSMTGSAGSWTATITTTAPRAFFQFRVLREGTAVIRNYVQQDLSSGIVVDGVRYYPHASGGTLTWTTTP